MAKRLRNETAAAFFCQRFPFTGNTPTTANNNKKIKMKKKTSWRRCEDQYLVISARFVDGERRSCWNTCCVNFDSTVSEESSAAKPQPYESSIELANHRPHVSAPELVCEFVWVPSTSLHLTHPTVLILTIAERNQIARDAE